MEKLRSKIFACFLALALVLLTTPIGLNLDTQNKSIEIQSNKAHAVVPVAGAAAALLAELAAASGLTVSEFVATVVGSCAVATGMGIAIDSGINYGNDAAVNLGNLMDAADYPAWDTLPDSTKEAWGDKQYYDSAKFNSLLDAFGLGDARERFYSSGGGFEFTADETNRLEQLGRIGQNWINNGSNTVQSVIDSMSPQYNQYIGAYLGHSTFKVVHGSDVDNWPSGAPETVNVNIGNYCLTKRSKSDGTSVEYVQTQSTDDVYFILTYYGANYSVKMFSKSGFSYGYNAKTVYDGQQVVLNPVTPTTQASEKTFQGNTFYYAGHSRSGGGNFAESTMAANATDLDGQIWVQICGAILFDSDATSTLGDIVPDIEGYPDDILAQGDTNVYFPAVGIQPGNTWENFETQPETPPVVDDEEDLSEIIELLKRFHFTVDYNLLVQDNPLRSAVLEIVSTLDKFKFYNVTGQLKVHDDGVYDSLGDIGGILRQIQATLGSFFVTDTASDVIGDFEFPELEDRALDLVDTISTLAPFGAMLMVSEVVSILSQVGKIQKPELRFDFGFMPGHSYPLVLDLSWMDQMKPVINIVCITTLILGLMGVTARLVELEAAA